MATEVLADAKKLSHAQGSARSIANRSYYAMFYAVLATIGQGSAKHSGVISLFDLNFVKAGLLPKELSKILHRAFDLRQQGDYGEAGLTVSIEDAADLLQNSEIFVSAIQAYLIDCG
ncbi:MAG: HEPN domain-containing protein [Peptococcaceae bacterium]|nr:HEPN domain-containing protein [Peptococcaceae bacterium]